MAWKELELDDRDKAMQALSWAMLDFFDKGGTIEDCEKIASFCMDSLRRAQQHHQLQSQ